MTIRNRLTLRFFLLVLGIILLASITIFVFSEMHRQEDFYIRMKNKASSTAKLLVSVDEGNVDLLRKIEHDNPFSLPQEGIVIWNVKNHVLFDSDRKGIISANLSELTRVRQEGEVRIESGGYEVLGFLFSDGGDRFVVFICAQDIFGRRRVVDLKWVMFTVFGISLGFIILAGWFYAGRALLPISKIIEQVKRISISSLNLRLEEGNNIDELSRLSQTFNSMLERLESAVKIQKEFIANASHEMRTPLTSMTGQLEVALMSERTAGRYKEVLLSILDDIKNLNRTSNRLLLLAQANSLELQIEKDLLRIDDLAWQCREELIKLQPKYTINIHLDFDTENENCLEVFGNEQLLKTAISNLMENGCKYSIDNTVELTLHSNGEGNILIFSDHGIGIPEKDLSNIFQPFYRASNSNSARGHGIGLSLVQKIMQVHSGKVTVSSVLGVGSTFTLSLPTSTEIVA